MSDMQKLIRDSLEYGGNNSEEINKLLNSRLERALIDGYSIDIFKYEENQFIGNVEKLAITKARKTSFESTVTEVCGSTFGKNVSDVLLKLENLLLGYDKEALTSNEIIDELIDGYHLKISRIGDSEVVSFIINYDSNSIIHTGIGNDISASIKALEKDYISKNHVYTDENTFDKEQPKKY